MSSLTTKYTRRSSAPTSEIAALSLRPVEAPTRVTKLDRESNAVVLGSKEPDEGRYSTLVRQSYTHAAPSALPTLLNAERKDRAVAMQTKNFRFGHEGEDLPIVSETQGAQQTAVDLRRREFASQRLPPSPTPYTSAVRTVAPSPVAKQAEDIKSHMDRMRSSNVFAGPVATETAAHIPPHTSTQRSSYLSHDSQQQKQQRDDAARLRRIQTQTSWTTGHEDVKDWKSVKQSTMRGAHGAPATLSTQNLTTCVNIGSEAVSSKETLASLKSIDYKAHRAEPTPPPAFTAHEDHLVFGYRPRDVNSTNRVSYTPTVFVPPSGKDSLIPRQYRAPV
jgi:hypothetical protein